MSKSLARVRAALEAAGVAFDLREMAAETRTAEQAAAAAGCALDQIVKSVLFRGSGSGQLRLFLTAGGNRIDPDRASTLAQEPLERADAALIRAETGFAIGGVAPLGHLNPCAPPYLRHRTRCVAAHHRRGLGRVHGPARAKAECRACKII